MKKLPAIRWKTLDSVQRERLRRWIKEREMGLLLEHERGIPAPYLLTGPNAPGPMDEFVAPFDSSPPHPGEIRLLSAWLLPEARRPLYVLILADWEDDLKLIAPFGPITEPATSGELRTRRDNDLALTVLCLWNTHSVPASRLARSWIIDRMGEAELAEAWTVFRHAATGALVDTALEARIGSPILDDDDPRIAYQAEEAALFAPLAEEIASEVVDGVIVQLPALLNEFQRGMLELAAAAEAPAGPVECFDVPARSVSIKVHLEEDHQNATLFVHDAAGEPSASLDGAEVVDQSGRPLAKIAGSFATFPFRSGASGIGVRLSSGQALHLRPSQLQ